MSALGVLQRPMKTRESFETAYVTAPDASGAATRHLCIVARHPVVSGAFVAGLAGAVGLRDALEVIVDRRRDSPPTVQPSFERRRSGHVVDALERDGFAVVAVPAAARPGSSSAQPDRGPIERGAEEADQRRLEYILWHKHERIVRLSRWLILSVLVNAILVLFFVSPAVTTRLSSARPAVSRPSPMTPVEKIAEPVSPRPAPTRADDGR